MLLKTIRGRGDYTVNDPSYEGDDALYLSRPQRVLKYLKKNFNAPLDNRTNEVVRGVGKAVGGLAGGFFPAIGRPLGTILGELGAHALHRGVKTITGRGDYRIRRNSLFKAGAMNSTPVFAGKRYVRIRHREYVANIKAGGGTTSSAFVADVFNIQPSNVKTFPWVSSIAKNFDEYRFMGLVFEFKSLSGIGLASTNTALGEMIMATQYNVLQTDFANKKQMYQNEYINVCKPSQSALHGVECKPGETPSKNLFIFREEDHPEQSHFDSRLYDHGKFTIASEGLPSPNQPIGELWVSYDLILEKPHSNALTLAGAGEGYHVHNYGNAIISNTDALGPNPVIVSTPGFDDWVLSYSSPTWTLTIPEGVQGLFSVNYFYQGTTNGVLTATTINCAGGASFYTGIITDSTNAAAAGFDIGNGTTQYSAKKFIQIDGAQESTITLTGGVKPTGNTRVDLIINPLFVTS